MIMFQVPTVIYALLAGSLSDKFGRGPLLLLPIIGQVLEGIALTGDPSFDIFKAAYPHGLRRARELFGVEGLARIAAAAGRARVARPVHGAEAAPIARRLTTV